MPMEFYETEPTLDNYWRSIILFGRNAACYKFALSKALIDLSNNSRETITLDDLAAPFAKHICTHLQYTDRQTISPSSKFLEICRSFNRNEITETSLVTATAKLGFKNVIDAFHNVNLKEIPQRFFVDERQSTGGIRLTDNFFKLFSDNNRSNLYGETEARWRLVETAWSLNVSRNLITVEHDVETKLLFSQTMNRRTNITSCRDALNGYQKGRCFYSFKYITVLPNDEQCADVDHFFPHILKTEGIIPNLDGVWNLVLSSKECNRGEGGKFAKLPSLKLLARLHKRNEYLISSHHPLRETLMMQTGMDQISRRQFLQNCYNRAKTVLIHTWEPASQDNPAF